MSSSFQQLASCFSTSCNSSFSPPPFSCAEKKHSGLVYPCACGICVPFRLHFVLGFLFVPHRETRHFILPSLQAFTSAPHSFGSLLPFHSASSINSVSHYPSIFPRISSGIFYFLRRVSPNERILLVLIRNGFFFQKDSKYKYNKDFLSTIFTDKKIKNLAKIRRPTQTNALGSKGQALRVLRKNLHTYASFR